MAHTKLVQEVIHESLQHNLAQLQEKYENFKNTHNLSIYSSQVAAFHNCYKIIEMNTNYFEALVQSGKGEEAKYFYYQTYKKDFETILPIVDFFTAEMMNNL